jgi:ribonuclease J
VKITFLGGLGEIGRNCAAIEIDRKILLLDCGLMFPDHDMLGVDVVLPDFGWLIERASDIVGCVLTHGHEDHIGGLPYLLREVEFPIFAAPLTARLARPRIEEAKLLGRTSFHEVGDFEVITVGPFEVEFIPMTHSVPYGMGIALHTPQGVIFHTGDFKIDLTPVDGRRSGLARIGELASTKGVRLLLSDSTNADGAGYTTSEVAVGKVLFDLMRQQPGKRIVTACFASHLHRVQQIADAAAELGRYVVPLGRSMVRNIDLGREMGVLSIPDDRLVGIEDIGELDPGEICVVSTGSQGEPMSALALMGTGESRWLDLGEDDVVILSSHPIPGNEHSVNKVIDNLMRLGADVVHSGIADVHATGHAKQEELKLMLALCGPDWFVPVHGEFAHMVHHARLAMVMGVEPSHILVCEDGNSITLGAQGLRRSGEVPSEFIYVLSERRVLGDEGVVTAIICVDFKAQRVVSGPEIVTRGWVHEPESAELLKAAADRVREAVDTALGAGNVSPDELRRVMRKSIGSYVSQRTRRRPMIVPVVLSA